MARGRSGRSGRVGYSNARRSPSAPDPFNDAWLQRIREPRYNFRYIDLGSTEDRRRWHPTKYKEWTQHPGPKGLRYNPRIIVVGSKSRLARHQTYGGRYSLEDVQRMRPTKASIRYGSVTTWNKDRQRGPHGVHDVIRMDRMPYRVGFSLPWQVIICVRRKRRKEVLHAAQIAGRKGVGAGKKQNRNQHSEIRC